MDPTVLVVNPGSSSREYSLFSKGTSLLNSYYEHTGESAKLTTVTPEKSISVKISMQDYENALSHFLETINSLSEDAINSLSGVGIRLVAPGRRFLEHKKLDKNLHEYLKNSVEQAPLHLKTELDQIDQIQKYLPNIPIFIISDSEFHKTLSHEARNYAIPKNDADMHDIYRYGYHGISVKSVVHVLREELTLQYNRIIVCHLGSGSSITAIKDWRSVETSMGYSPLEGLIMATRSGNIDVVAAIQLKRHLKFNDRQLLDYLNTQCGLLGLSGSSNDIREILDSEESGNENAKFSLDAMVYRIQSYIGAYFAILGGLDALVFTATVGERSAILRRRICESVSHLGIELDSFTNDQIDTKNAVISKSNSPVAIHVVPSNEPAEIARQTFHLLANK